MTSGKSSKYSIFKLWFKYSNTFTVFLFSQIRTLLVELTSTALSNYRLIFTTCSSARLSSQTFTAVSIDLQTSFLKCKVEFSTLKGAFPRQTNPRVVDQKLRQKRQLMQRFLYQIASKTCTKHKIYLISSSSFTIPYVASSWLLKSLLTPILLEMILIAFPIDLWMTWKTLELLKTPKYSI